jgi:hypothetical protein
MLWFQKYFRQKIWRKNWRSLVQKNCKRLQNSDHNIVFL